MPQKNLSDNFFSKTIFLSSINKDFLNERNNGSIFAATSNKLIIKKSISVINISEEYKKNLEDQKSKIRAINLPEKNRFQLEEIAILLAESLWRLKLIFEYDDSSKEIKFNFKEDNTSLTFEISENGEIGYYLAFLGYTGGMVRFNGNFKPGKKKNNIRYIEMISDMLISKKIIDDESASKQQNLETCRIQQDTALCDIQDSRRKPHFLPRTTAQPRNN